MKRPSSRLFAEAHGFPPGDSFDVLNQTGETPHLSITGIPLVAPEYVYCHRPGTWFRIKSVVVIQLPQSARGAYDMKGRSKRFSDAFASADQKRRNCAARHHPQNRMAGPALMARADHMSDAFRIRADPAQGDGAGSRISCSCGVSGHMDPYQLIAGNASNPLLKPADIPSGPSGLHYAKLTAGNFDCRGSDGAIARPHAEGTVCIAITANSTPIPVLVSLQEPISIVNSALRKPLPPP